MVKKSMKNDILFFDMSMVSMNETFNKVLNKILEDKSFDKWYNPEGYYFFFFKKDLVKLKKYIVPKTEYLGKCTFIDYIEEDTSIDSIFDNICTFEIADVTFEDINFILYPEIYRNQKNCHDILLKLDENIINELWNIIEELHEKKYKFKILELNNNILPVDSDIFDYHDSLAKENTIKAIDIVLKNRKLSTNDKDTLIEIKKLIEKADSNKCYYGRP